MRFKVGFFRFMYTNDQIWARIKQLDTYKGLPDGIYDVWLRKTRTPGNYNLFCDEVRTFKVENGVPRFIMACSGTSTAGSFGLKKFFTYNSLGCAVIDGDQIVYGSHVFGYHKHIPNAAHEAYVQVKGMRYHRDNDKDDIAEDTLGPAHYDVIGANCHRAGIFSKFIVNFSVACLVRNILAQFLAWLNFMKKEGKPPLNVAILKEENILTVSATVLDARPQAQGADEQDATGIPQTGNHPSSSQEQWPILKRGSKGKLVVTLQKRLVALGYSLTTDGDYGPKTEQAVLNFQGKNALKMDGRVGPETKHALGL